MHSKIRHNSFWSKALFSRISTTMQPYLMVYFILCHIQSIFFTMICPKVRRSMRKVSTKNTSCSRTHSPGRFTQEIAHLLDGLVIFSCSIGHKNNLFFEFQKIFTYWFLEHLNHHHFRATSELKFLIKMCTYTLVRKVLFRPKAEIFLKIS